MHIPSAFMYLLSSSLIMYTNKQVMSVYGLYPTYLMMAQSVILLVYLFCVCQSTIHCNKKLFGLALLYSCNVFFGLMGSTHMSIAVFTALRRVSIGFTLLGEIFFLKQRKSASVIWCVWFMMAAVALVAIDDTTASFHGYMLVMINNVLTAAVVIISKSILDSDADKETVLTVNNLCQLCISGVISVHQPWEASVPGFCFLCASGCLGALIQFSATWSVQENGPLTQSILGSSKNVAMSLLSCMHIIDNDYVFTWINFMALQVTALASFLYMWVSI